MRIFLNGLGASAGAGLTYLYNVIPRLSARPDLHITLAVQPSLRNQFAGAESIEILDKQIPSSAARRFWFEQRELPSLIRRSGADVLISAGNFAVRNSPVPQILLSGNSLYTSPDFERDLRERNEYGLWLDNRIKASFARRSIIWSDFTVAPSQAFADQLERWAGKKVCAIHHGFNPEIFFGDPSPLPDVIQAKLDANKDCLRLLFVSHYNYYRNFETLLRAVALLRDASRSRPVRLFLTCTLKDEENPGSYKTGPAASLMASLDIANEVVQLGAVPYRLLHQVYRACDIYVTPAYTETFAHPLVEAMASGLPIVASDLAVHREICGEALFFERFSPEELAAQVLSVANDPELCRRLRESGLERSRAFSWDRHVEQLLGLAAGLVARGRAQV